MSGVEPLKEEIAAAKHAKNAKNKELGADERQSNLGSRRANYLLF